MKLEIKINNLPPCPRNRSHQVVRNMLIKTDLARAFEKDLTELLENYREDFRNFVAMVRLHEHYLSVVYTIYTPRDSLFTKDGRISAKSVDLDAHKVFQDTIFKAIGLDDKLIRDVRYVSPVSFDGKWNYVINIEVQEIKQLEVSDGDNL